MDGKILSDPEIRRFHQQMNLMGFSIEGQEKIKMAKIAVIGAGGIGSVILQYLASAGIGNFGIIDDGLVDEQNIQRQTLYGSTDLGKLKTIICRQKLQSIFPLSNYEIINLRLDAQNINKILKPFTYIIDATNNKESSLLINDACISMGKSWIFGSVSGLEIKVSVFNFNNGPSYKCFIESEKIINENRNEQTGKISLTYGLAGILMATETIKLVTGQKEILSGLLYSFNLNNYQSRIEQITKIDKFFQTSSV